MFRSFQGWPVFVLVVAFFAVIASDNKTVHFAASIAVGVAFATLMLRKKPEEADERRPMRH